MSAITPPSITEQVPQLLAEFGVLLDKEVGSREFYEAFLQRLASATCAHGAALWLRRDDGVFFVERALNWSALGLEAIPDGTECHNQVLAVAAERERALWVPPHSGRKLVGGDRQAANLSAHALLLAPVVVDKCVVGLLEIWTEPAADDQDRQVRARFLMDMAGLVAAYLHKSQLRRLQEQQRLWTELAALSRHIHGSLEPKTVSQWLANEGRRLLDCEQLSVILRWGNAVQVEAISGCGTLESGGRTVQTLEALGAAVLRWGERLVYKGQRDETLPPAVAGALDAYLAESNATVLIVLPVDGGRAEQSGCGVLVAEVHGPSLAADGLLERMQTLASFAGPALANALHVARLPLRRLSAGLASVREWGSRQSYARLGFYGLPLVLLVGILTLVQAPLRLEAKGQLLPMQRQIAYAPLSGKIVELKVRHGDRVDKDQELLLMEDLDSQLQIDQIAIKIASTEQRIALLSDQIGKSINSEERNGLVRERINQEFEMRKATAERDILLQGSRSPRQAPVLAPLAGKVVTFDIQEQLLGKTVKPGDPLLRVAAVKGAWEIEVRIPERALGPIREGLRGRQDAYLDVDVLLANQPKRTYRGRLYLDGLGGETTVKDDTVALPARVRITDADLLPQLESLPVGLEVRAKLNCGQRPLGQAWFFELWEFVYEHLLF